MFSLMQMPEVQFHSIGKKRLLYKFAAHEKRVRCLRVIAEEEGEDDGSAKRRLCLVTASNDGFIKAWSVERRGEGKFEVALAASQDTKCRITCMAVHKVGLWCGQYLDLDLEYRRT